MICDLIYRLTPDPTYFDNRFLMYQLLTPHGRSQIERDARGSSGTMPKIAQRHIKSWMVVVPSLDEQRQIIETIEDAVNHINQVAHRAEAEIYLLREYRTRLIADVVTGKLDVREAAAKLPDILAGETEAEPLDDDGLAESDEGTSENDLEPAPEETEA